MFLFFFKSSLISVLDRFSAAEGSKAEIGPVKIEIGRTILPPQYRNEPPIVATTVKIDYGNRIPKIKDEGVTGATAGYSTSYALEILLYDTSFKGKEVSARGIYEGAKLKDELKGIHTGTSVHGVIKALMDEGFYWESDWPNDKPKKPTTALPASKISGYKLIDSITDVIPQLKAGLPVIAAIHISDEFSTPKDGVVKLSAEPVVKGVGTICIVGYDQETKLFKFAQSWGTGWGESGFGYISENDLKTVWWGGS